MSAVRVDLSARRPRSERVASALLLATALVSVLTTAGIVTVLLTESLAFFRQVPLSAFLGDSQWTPLFADKHFGIWPLLSGTLLTTAIAIGVGLPLGLLAAIYLAELAAPRARRVLKPVVEVLAGVPTVVYGTFALTVVTPLLQRVVPGLSSFNALGAGVVMGIMLFPIIASLSEDALSSVPPTLREAALALGGSRVATIVKVVVPSAFSGITAAVILAVSRAVGETMIVAIAAGQQPRLTLDPRVPIETMTAYIVQVSLGDTPSGTLEHRTLFAVGLALFALTLVLNVVSHAVRGAVTGGARR